MTAGGALLADGQGQALTVRRFTNPALDAVRQAISDSAVIQAIGRGRAVNRTAATPLTVHVFADVVLPMPVEEVVPWVAPNAYERMLARRGCAPTSSTDAAKLFPDLFTTRRAARCAIDAVPPTWQPPPAVVRVFYQPTGRGQANRSAWALTRELDQIRHWLTSAFGRLAVFRPET